MKNSIKLADIVKEIIEQELKKEEGLIRDHIQLEIDVVTESDWFYQLVEKLIKKILKNL